jgi:predicted branched-subunit amino acid permease
VEKVYLKENTINQQDIWCGFKALLPLCFFVVIFGAAFSLAAKQAGLENASIMAMSTFVFAGAAQFAVLELWGLNVPVIPLCLTVFAINARHLLMGASLYIWLQHLPVVKRYAVMLVASDANWAMAMRAYDRGESGLGLLLGGGLALWFFWVLGTLGGLYFESIINDPVSLGLDMVMSCFLLTMLVSGDKNLRTFAIWAIAAISSILAFYYLPENSHIIVGTLTGGLFGSFWYEEAA